AGADGADHRDHAGFDVGVSAAGVHAGDHGTDVPAVRAGDCGDGADLGGERIDVEADAVRVVAAVAVVLIGLAGWGLTRVPTGFIPTEDQGYLMIAVQMPDGASLERAQNVMDRISKIGLDTPGAAHAIAIGTGGPSPLDGDVS